MKKKIEIKTYEMGESIFAAIVFFLLGVYLVTDPKDMIKIILYIFGGFSILLGVFKLLVYYKSNQEENKKDIINGIVFMIFGMIAILCTAIFFDTVETILRFVVGIYLLYVGINRLVSAFKVKESKTPYFVNALIIIAIGVALCAIPGLPLRVMGIFIIVYAVAEIIGFVLSRKNGYTPSVQEAVVVKETIKTEVEDTKLLK